MNNTFETIHALLRESEVIQRMDRSEVFDKFWEMVLSLYQESENNQTKEVKIICELKKLIDENCQDQKYIEFYADKLNVTLSYLNECTRAVLNKSVLQLITERLILEAKLLLRSKPDLLTKELCFRLGFEDPTYFCRFFKKHTGLTPQGFKILVSSDLLQ